MSVRLSSAALVSLVLWMAAAPGAQTQPREFSGVRELGRALVEFDDGLTQAVAAYHHSQRNHDSRWLLIEFGLMGRRAVAVDRGAVELLAPNGRVVPLASQRQWQSDGARARLLMQQAQPSRHQVRSYFRETNGIEFLRFFAPPDAGTTVVDRMQAAPEQVLLGDLLFASPSGLWDRGVYVLTIRRADGDVRLPIELR